MSLIALVGNPNVGKSSLYNRLTGKKRHTGNWTGKTVDYEIAPCKNRDFTLQFADLPGTYSLVPKSQEEEITGNFLISHKPDKTLVVADAANLMRSIVILFEVMEITDNVVLCVNMTDRLASLGIEIDYAKLSEEIGIPVVAVSTRNGSGIRELLETLSLDTYQKPIPAPFTKPIEAAIKKVIETTEIEQGINPRGYAIRYLLQIGTGSDSGSSVVNYSPVDCKSRTVTEPQREIFAPFDLESSSPAPSKAEHSSIPQQDIFSPTPAKTPTDTAPLCKGSCHEVTEGLPTDTLENSTNLTLPRLFPEDTTITTEILQERITRLRILHSEAVVTSAIKSGCFCCGKTQRKADKLLTGKGTSLLFMLLMLSLIFWLTLSGANYLSDILSVLFTGAEEWVFETLTKLNLPEFFTLPFCRGILHILFRVISVMTPPMLIFFPLFTFLEEIGYLPRVAFNLDRHFKGCMTSGKQAYSMCMGFGCNAAGVTGARIIDSPRERVLSILTNSLVPCNGKFPALTSLITMFLIFGADEKISAIKGALILTGLVTLSVFATFLVTKILAKTLMKGKTEPFVLELPSYKRPKITKILTQSIFDRGVFLILRAAAVSAPCGLVIWSMSNLTIGDTTLLHYCAQLLDPAGRALGMDGTILLAFILGFPANEIVIPLIVTGYSSLSTLALDGGLDQIRNLFIANGWTTLTAVNVILFMLFHWPCSTTILTVKKETGSNRLTLLAFAIPTLIGIGLCLVTTLIFG